MVGDVTLTGSSDISKHFVNHFKNLFNNNSHIQNNGMVEEVIPSNYRPIAIANFKFKIISKILADRLSKFMPAITSTQQRGSIKGRCIKEWIFLTYEAINVLNKKTFKGNVAMEIDMAKAFDTIDWNFLLKVLKSFGFCEVFYKWIHSILHSAKLTISINGKIYGYFSCHRGVRHGILCHPFFSALLRKLSVEVYLSWLEMVSWSWCMVLGTSIFLHISCMLMIWWFFSEAQTLSSMLLRMSSSDMLQCLIN